MVEARKLAGHQKEAVVHEGSAGSRWRLASDEGKHLTGTDLAPFPLGFFNAGLHGDVMGRILGLDSLRQITNALLQRKTEAELELMRETAAAGRILREEAVRFDRAKCHAGLPALRAWAARSEAHRDAVRADCGLGVVLPEAALDER